VDDIRVFHSRSHNYKGSRINRCFQIEERHANSREENNTNMAAINEKSILIESDDIQQERIRSDGSKRKRSAKDSLTTNLCKKIRQEETFELSSEESYDTQTFPEKIMELLQENSFPDAIWWLPCGKVVVVKEKEFTENVLNKIFQGTKFLSFVRTLNRWGFKKKTRRDLPSGVKAFHHELFLKNAPDLAKYVRREGVRKKKTPKQNKMISSSDSTCSNSSRDNDNMLYRTSSKISTDSISQTLVSEDDSTVKDDERFDDTNPAIVQQKRTTMRGGEQQSRRQDSIFLRPVVSKASLPSQSVTTINDLENREDSLEVRIAKNVGNQLLLQSILKGQPRHDGTILQARRSKGTKEWNPPANLTSLEGGRITPLVSPLATRTVSPSSQINPNTTDALSDVASAATLLKNALRRAGIGCHQDPPLSSLVRMVSTSDPSLLNPTSVPASCLRHGVDSLIHGGDVGHDPQHIMMMVKGTMERQLQRRILTTSNNNPSASISPSSTTLHNLLLSKTSAQRGLLESMFSSYSSRITQQQQQYRQLSIDPNLLRVYLEQQRR